MIGNTETFHTCTFLSTVLILLAITHFFVHHLSRHVHFHCHVTIQSKGIGLCRKPSLFCATEMCFLARVYDWTLSGASFARS